MKSLFDSADAEARRSMLPDGGRFGSQPGSCAKPAPVVGDKASTDRHRSIISGERMEPQDRCNQTKEMVRNRLAMKIVDEPSQAGRALHPSQQCDDLRIGQVMRQKRTDDDIGIRSGISGKCIADNPLNPLRSWSRLLRSTDGVRVQVDSGQFNIDSSSVSPPVDSPQHIAITAADVDHAQPARMTGMSSDELVHPRNRRSIRKGEPVHPRDVMETIAKLLIAARPIHQLGQIGTARKIQSRRRRNFWRNHRRVRIGQLGGWSVG